MQWVYIFSVSLSDDVDYDFGDSFFKDCQQNINTHWFLREMTNIQYNYVDY